LLSRRIHLLFLLVVSSVEAACVVQLLVKEETGDLTQGKTV